MTAIKLEDERLEKVARIIVAGAVEGMYDAAETAERSWSDWLPQAREIDALYVGGVGQNVSRSQPSDRRADALSVGLDAAGSAPEPPWAIGPSSNAKRAGWAAFFAGKDRNKSPYPPARGDLAAGYAEGWDTAQAKATGS